MECLAMGFHFDAYLWTQQREHSPSLAVLAVIAEVVDAAKAIEKERGALEPWSLG